VNIKTILSKPLPVIWYRLVQLVRLRIYHKTNFWLKIETKVSQKTKSSKECCKQKSSLFADEPYLYKDTFSEGVQQYIKSSADTILNGNISIFDNPHHFDYPFKWNKDWRSGHVWKNNYFKTYSFYEENKAKEYDVKFPWELSRLSFLIPISRAYLMTGEAKYIDYIHNVLFDWKQKNPIAHSVNWYPMEVSVRSLNLVQLRELLLLTPSSEKTVDLLNEILILHGIFLWRNVEYTDVRGNHYSANLTALLLLGTSFKGFYKEAEKWQNYALSNIENEFHLQFIDDGVNFEKSIAYHRLVVEFYLICFLVMQRLGLEIQPKTKQTFKNACFFIKDYTKPNSLTPIIGDNDSASVFQNDELPLNDHTNIVQLASLFLDSQDLNNTTKIHCSSIELFGLEKVKALNYNPTEGFKVLSYPIGGFAVVKDNSNYFITDVGEVGMNGRGGHGHNDLFAFELMLNGQDLIVDAGCYTYTGDLKLKNQMKASAYHNVLTIDDEEIAPLIGNWGIANSALPYDVTIKEEHDEAKISGKHNGYKRLADAVRHERTFVLNKTNFRLSCSDVISCKSKHAISRHLHFSEKVDLAIIDNSVVATLNNNRYSITYDKESQVKVEEYYLSYNYGHKTSAKKLIFEAQVTKTGKLYFAIEKLGNNE